MKNYPVYLIAFFMALIVCTNLHAEEVKYSTDTIVNDTVKSKETKKIRKTSREGETSSQPQTIWY